ncbi:MAG: GIY-YIG nuclease family protein [bacterium]
MKNPKTIKIFLVEGEPTGIRIAELSNWTGKGTVIPRNRLKNIKNRTDISQPAVYFLFGESEETGEPIVYVGEAENLYNRLSNHDNKKDFWNTALAFTSKDQNLTKAHVKFLENYCIDLLKKVNRVKLDNSSDTSKPTLPEADIAEMLEFGENLQLLTSALGYQIFKDISAKQIDDKNIYFCKKKGIEAKGTLLDEGFVIYKGSQAITKEANSAGKWLHELRERLLTSDVLRKENEFSYIFTKDYIFGSPSTAGAVVLGCRVNGWIHWKNNKGQPLDKERDLSKEN